MNTYYCPSLIETKCVVFDDVVLTDFSSFPFYHNCSNKRDIGGMESPHDSFVWSLAWHPLGHMLCSGSNDHTWFVLPLPSLPPFSFLFQLISCGLLLVRCSKFWCRNRPGDEMKDRHSSGGLPIEEVADSG